MDKRAITRASKKLELRDISLHASTFTRNKDIDPGLYPYSVDKDTTIEVKSEKLSFKDEKNEEILIFRTYINFSLIGFVKEEDSILEFFTIQTIYRIDYEIIKDITTDEMKEFSKYNVVHNVWSFWRQHIYYIVNNANLPRITIPFFRNTGVNKPDKRKRRSAIRGKKTVKRIASGS